MARELGIDEPLDEGYWESLGMQGEQARAGDPFSSPPPGSGASPFSGHGGPSGRSSYEPTWLRTRCGIEFIDVFVGEAPGSDDTHMLIFLYEGAPGRWAVGFSRPKTLVGFEFMERDVDYETAKAFAVTEAATMSVDAGANASWRRDPASLGQLGFARKLGIELDTDTATKGDASDAINQVTGSRTLDPILNAKKEPS